MTLDEEAIEFAPLQEDPTQTELEVQETTDQEESVEQETTQQEPDELAKFTYEEYKNRGLIVDSEDNPFDGTLEWIEEQMDKLPTIVQNNLISKLPTEARDFVDLLLTKPNLTKDDFRQFYQDFLNDESPVVETVDEARTFLESVYAEKGLKPKAIQAQLDDLEDENQLIDEAKKELDKKGSITKANLQAVKQQETEYQKQHAEFLTSVQTEIGTYNPIRQKAIKEIAPNVGQIVNDISSNPKAYTQLLDILTYYKDGKFDLSKFEKQAETKAVSKFKDRLSSVQISTERRDAGKTSSPKIEFLPD